MTTPKVLAAARAQNPERSSSSSTAIPKILALPGPAWTNQPAVAEAELKLAAKTHAGLIHLGKFRHGHRQVSQRAAPVGDQLWCQKLVQIERRN